MQKLIKLPKAQRRAEKRALTGFVKTYNKQSATACAYLSGHHIMVTIADEFNLNCTKVSRQVKGLEGQVYICCNARLDPDHLLV